MSFVAVNELRSPPVSGLSIGGRVDIADKQLISAKTKLTQAELCNL